MTTDTAEEAEVITPQRRGPERGPKGQFLPNPDAPHSKSKRGPGRPKGAKNKKQSTPKRAAPRKTLSRWEKIAGAIVMFNAGLAVFAADDALVEDEIRLLADALDAECDVYPQLERALVATAKLSPHFQLLQAVVVITLPRLERRGMLPNGTAEQLAGAAQPVAPGSAHEPGGDDPERQEHPGEPAPVGLAIPGNTTNED